MTVLRSSRIAGYTVTSVFAFHLNKLTHTSSFLTLLGRAGDTGRRSDSGLCASPPTTVMIEWQAVDHFFSDFQQRQRF
jgi:hypothetical protein